MSISIFTIKGHNQSFYNLDNAIHAAKDIVKNKVIEQITSRPWIKPWAARFQAKRAEFCFIVWDAKKSPQILCNLTVDRLPKIC